MHKNYEQRVCGQELEQRMVEEGKGRDSNSGVGMRKLFLSSPFGWLDLGVLYFLFVILDLLGS